MKRNKNADLRDEFKHYEDRQLTETEEFSVFKMLFDAYLKKGDREKFYEKYYAQIPLKSKSFFRGLSRNAATLLAIKVADSMLAHCKHMKSSHDNSVHPKLSYQRKRRLGCSIWVGMYCTIFTKIVEESFQMKASRQWLSSKLGNWSMALLHKGWFPVWTAVVSGL